MKKTLRSVLTLLLVVMMAFGVAAPIISYAADNVPAPQSNGGSGDSSYDAGWLAIERVGDELIVTLSPDIDSALQINREVIEEIAGELLGHAKDIVINSLKEDILNGQYGDGEEGFTDLDSVWTTALGAYIERCGCDRDDYVGFFKKALEDDALIDGLIDYACSLLVAAHKAGIVDNETLDSYDVEAAIEQAFNAKVSELLEEHKTKNINAYIAYIFGEGEADAVDSAVLSFADAEVASYVYDIALNAYYSTGLNGESYIEDGIELMVKLGKEEGKTLDEIITKSTAVSFLRDVVAEIDDANAIASAKATIESKVSGGEGYSDKLYSAVLGLSEAEFNAKLDEYTDRMLAGYDKTVAELSDIDTKISIVDIIGYINEITVNGNELYGIREEGSGTEVKIGNFKKLLAEIPNFAEIAEMADDEMQLSFDITIGTIFDSTCKFTLTGKIGGGYDEIRAICAVISRHVSFDYSGGKIVFNADIPEKVSRAILKAVESDRIDPALKSKVFSAFMADGNDVYALIKELSFNDLIKLLECIDFEGILDSETIKQYVDLTGYTNEQIIAKVKQYERYFNIALKYALRLADKVVKHVPEKYMDNCILDILGYEDSNDKVSYADGTFRYEGTHTLSYELIEKALKKALPYVNKALDKAGIQTNIDDTMLSILLGLIPDKYVENGFTLSADITVDVAKINRIDYEVNGEAIRSGFLPAGADVNDFAPKTENLLCWVDQYRRVITKMPDYDVVLTAVFNDGEVYPTNDIDKIYNGKSETVGVFIGDNVNTYTYEWYKDGKLLSVTTNSLEVINVADSGVYTYVVYSNGVESHTGDINVSIRPATIDTSSVALDENFFEYDGKAHTVNLTGVPAGVTPVISGVTTASAIGDYKVYVSFETDDNHVVAPASVELAWSIKYVIDVSKFEWIGPLDENDPENDIIPFYSGKTYEVILTDGDIDDDIDYLEYLEIEYNADRFGIDAGEYVAKILSVKLTEEAINAGYVLVGTDELPECAWYIEAASVHVSSDDFVWSVDKSFTFDGTTHGVYITEWPEMLAQPEYIENGTYAHEEKDAGSYVAAATFALKAEHEKNYNIVYNKDDLADGIVTCEWSIIPKVYDVDQLTWTDFSGFVYNGEKQTVEITNLPTFIEVENYYATSSYNAGTLSAIAELVCTDSNYVLSKDTVTYEWSIAKAEVIISGINWNYVTGSIVYNKEDQTLAAPTFNLSVESVRDCISFVLTGNVGKDAASYQAVIGEFAYNSPDAGICNYYVTVADGEPLVLNWSIAPLAVDVSALTWNYTTPLVYNGELQGILLNSIPEGVTVEYSNNSFIDAGSYTASAIATKANDNYTVVGEIASVSWTISKAAIDGSSITFEDATVTYEHGKQHNLEIKGDADVLAMLDVTYEGNGKTLLGVYTVTATITVKEEYANNYTYSDELTATLTITGDKKNDHELKNNKDVIVKVEATEGLDPDNIIAGGITNKVESTYEIDGKVADVLVAYDIYFTEGGTVISVDGQTFKVKLLITAKYRDLEDDELMVIHIKDDGSVEVMDATREGDYMVFETNHFSKYAIVRVPGPSYAWLWIVLAIILIAGIAVGVYLVLLGKKDSEPAPDEIPEVEAAPVVEEAPEVEEIPEVEEEPVVEEIEEVPEVDEVVEEAEEDEISEVDEEITEAEEEPVAEEEEVVEELVAEEPVAEAAPVVEEPKTAVLVMGEDGKEATAIIGGEVVHIRFRSSFMSRLIQSTENIQGFYSAIKNHVLSYKGIKARGSWNYEAFNKGRIQLVKLNIKGRTLIVNLNLDPKEFNINKYHFIDCSDKPKFAKVPMMMKVRSGRALKYTLELIDEMMAKYELKQGEVPTVDYSMPYETTEELAKRGLVKVILPAGVTLSDDMTFVHVNVSELIESGTTEKTTEQLMVSDLPAEDAAVEETPVVEEAPVVEAAPVAEEAPVVEEHVVEVLEDGTVHADAEFADELVTDEEAESRIEVIHETVKHTGKIGEINLDVICENFEDDEIVDVDALKAKRLISPKIGRVKVLARGVMYKRLTVKASKFSLQAVKMITLAGGKAELED